MEENTQTTYIGTKDFILSFKEHCKVNKAINQLIFGDEAKRSKSIETLNYFN